MRSAEASAEEAFGDEESAEQDECHPGDLLGPLAEVLADPGAQAEPDLGRDQCLHADGDDHRDEGQADQAEAEPDRQLVQADADAERDDGRSAGGQQAACCLLVTVLVRGPVSMLRRR